MIIDLKDHKIFDEDQLAEFVSKESQVKNCLHLPQWRVFLKENYQNGKSFALLKMHHTMTDGYGVTAFGANVTDEWDAELLPHLPPFNKWVQILTMLAFPYNFFKLAYQYMLYPHDINPITRLNKDKGNSGVK
jgi:hypothetical protein